jgi:hypothetical protein
MGQLINSAKVNIYTPIFSAYAGSITSATLVNASFIQNNNSVIIYMYLQVNVDFSLSIDGEFIFTPPIATNLLNGNGVATIYTAKNNISAQIYANKIKLTCNDSSVTGLFDLFSTYQYLIN